MNNIACGNYTKIHNIKWPSVILTDGPQLLVVCIFKLIGLKDEGGGF